MISFVMSWWPATVTLQEAPLTHRDELGQDATMIPMETQVRHLLHARYPSGRFHLRLLADGGKYVYHVQRDEGADWIVRAYDAGAFPQAPSAVAKLVQILDVLNAHAIPAERVIHSRNGAPMVQQHTTHLLVTSYLGPSLQHWQPTTGQFADPSALARHTPLGPDLSQVLYGLGALLAGCTR